MDIYSEPILSIYPLKTMCHIYVKPLSGLFKKYTVFSGKKNIYHCWEWANKYLQAANETVEEHQQLTVEEH